ncbi:MAG: ferrous iron transport protein B [Candidatus Hydrogenedentota bacterium]
MSRVVIALAGNPNTGKTEVFNALTGLRQATGNYPGVTVERSTGAGRLNGQSVQFLDLPGAYSLAARDPSEEVTVDVIAGRRIDEAPVDAVVAVADASNLERNLYLATQLRELGKPLVVALNMIDIAERRGLHIDMEALSKALGCPVVPMCARKRQGIESLRAALANALTKSNGYPAQPAVEYPPQLLDALHQVQKQLTAAGEPASFGMALRLLADAGGELESDLGRTLGPAGRDALLSLRESTESELQDSIAAVEAQSRYAWIRNVLEGAVQKRKLTDRSWTGWADAVLLHRVAGPILFAGIMLFVFQAIFTGSAPLMEAIEDGVAEASVAVEAALPGEITSSLVAQGIMGGVGSVLVFLPPILVLALFIALLEDCGYMARAAFIMDRVFKWCGLSGKSFIPLLTGFGCAVPAIMATRTIESSRERIATILIVPLMSCAARLPVYALLIGAFIPARPVLGGVLGLQGLVLFAVYILGLVIALPVAWLLNRTVLKSEATPFLLELPTYKMPRVRTIGHKVFLQGKDFVVNAGGIILAMTIVVWALAFFPQEESLPETETPAVFAAAPGQRPLVGHAEAPRGHEAPNTIHADAPSEEMLGSPGQLNNSYLGRIGRTLEPVFKPVGWDWRVGTAVLAAFPAREVVVSATGAIFHLEESGGRRTPAYAEDRGQAAPDDQQGLRARLQEATWPDGKPLFTLPMVLGLLVFTSLCLQCGPTLAVMRRATGSWRWPVSAFVAMTLLAYGGALLTYQLGMWLV